MIEQSFINSVLSSIDIGQLVGEYVSLQGKGRRLKGLCPFHGEKTPSFHVSVDKGVFHCFGCGAGGSAIDFLMRIEGLKFHEAVERLAERCGLEVRYVSGSKGSKGHQDYYEILSLASQFFQKQYQSGLGEVARKYAERRGIVEQEVESFGLGYASGDWGVLSGYFRSVGVDLGVAVSLGLLSERESGGYYGRFRDRLMFPIHDERGRVVAFGGRSLEGSEVAKYINSPESEVYTKGNHLYGLSQAKAEIRRSGRIILMEGNIDVVIMHSHGYRESVAVMGTALTEAQAKLLSRFGDRVYLMFDGDKAGRKAMRRSLGILLGHDLSCYAVNLPEGEDPDSFVRSYGREGVDALLESSESLSMWCLRKQCEEILEKPIELRQHGLADLGVLLGSFRTDLARRHFLEESARLLSMDVVKLRELLGFEGLKSSEGVVVQSSFSHVVRDRVEMELLCLLVQYPEKLKEFLAEDGVQLIEDIEIRRLLESFESDEFVSGAIDAPAKLMVLKDERLKRLFEESLCMELSVDASGIDSWYRGAIANLTERWVSKEIVRLGYQLQGAITQGNAVESSELLERYQELQGLRLRSLEERRLSSVEGYGMSVSESI